MTPRSRGLLAAVLLLVLSVACEGDVPSQAIDDGGTAPPPAPAAPSETTPVPPTTAPPTPATTPTAAPAIGEVVTIEQRIGDVGDDPPIVQRFDVSVDELRCLPEVLDADGVRRVPAEGEVYCVAAITVTNRGAAGAQILLSFSTLLLDDQDEIPFDPILTRALRDDGGLQEPLDDGATLRGPLLFVVPADAVPTAVLLRRTAEEHPVRFEVAPDGR